MTPLKQYWRLRLGAGASFADRAKADGFIGADFGVDFDLAERFTDVWPDFNREFIPVFLENRPDKTRIAAGLAGGALHAVYSGIRDGDIVLSPEESGNFLVGEVNGDYAYLEGEVLPHRRQVTWFPEDDCERRHQ